MRRRRRTTHGEAGSAGADAVALRDAEKGAHPLQQAVAVVLHLELVARAAGDEVASDRPPLHPPPAFPCQRRPPTGSRWYRISLMPDSTHPRLLVVGFKISYFTGKFEGYLRYKEIPYDFQPMTPRWQVRIRKETGASQIPGVRLSDGRWMTDTTPMIAWFEAQHPGPEDAKAAARSLLEEHGCWDPLWRSADPRSGYDEEKAGTSLRASVRSTPSGAAPPAQGLGGDPDGADGQPHCLARLLIRPIDHAKFAERLGPGAREARQPEGRQCCEDSERQGIRQQGSPPQRAAPREDRCNPVDRDPDPRVRVVVLHGRRHDEEQGHSGRHDLECTHGFINTVVYNFVDQMMQSGNIHIPNIHGRSLANGFQSFQYFNIIFGIVVVVNFFVHILIGMTTLK